MSQLQMVWHAYHAGSLCQLVDLEDRREKIERIKSKHELPTRRRLMKPVVGQLPEEFVAACWAYDEARRACDEAWRAYAEARQTRAKACRAYDEACWAYDEVRRAYDEVRQTWAKVCRAYDEVRRAYDEACWAYGEARRAYDEAYHKHLPEIERLHTEQCPDCPWDGETIFPEDTP
jgi:DNA-binding transcriptional regulator PaaX